MDRMKKNKMKRKIDRPKSSRRDSNAIDIWVSLFDDNYKLTDLLHFCFSVLKPLPCVSLSNRVKDDKQNDKWRKKKVAVPTYFGVNFYLNEFNELTNLFYFYFSSSKTIPISSKSTLIRSLLIDLFAIHSSIELD